MYDLKFETWTAWSMALHFRRFPNAMNISLFEPTKFAILIFFPEFFNPKEDWNISTSRLYQVAISSSPTSRSFRTKEVLWGSKNWYFLKKSDCQNARQDRTAYRAGLPLQIGLRRKGPGRSASDRGASTLLWLGLLRDSNPRYLTGASDLFK